MPSQTTREQTGDGGDVGRSWCYVASFEGQGVVLIHIDEGWMENGSSVTN